MALTCIEVETMTMIKSACRDLCKHFSKKRKIKKFENFTELETFVSKENVSVEDIKDFPAGYVLIYT